MKAKSLNKQIDQIKAKSEYLSKDEIEEEKENTLERLEKPIGIQKTVSCKTFKMSKTCKQSETCK